MKMKRYGPGKLDNVQRHKIRDNLTLVGLIANFD
jgi:hypothetical protein